jgi:hypothetical protein
MRRRSNKAEDLCTGTVAFAPVRPTGSLGTCAPPRWVCPTSAPPGGPPAKTAVPQAGPWACLSKPAGGGAARGQAACLTGQRGPRAPRQAGLPCAAQGSQRRAGSCARRRRGPVPSARPGVTPGAKARPARAAPAPNWERARGFSLRWLPPSCPRLQAQPSGATGMPRSQPHAITIAGRVTKRKTDPTFNMNTASKVEMPNQVPTSLWA